ncbi:MAG: NAD-dependent epimerase/dehydratase family protein, partial [Rubrivivax sp.]
MAQMLILGGTQFVGRHIAAALLAAGHGLTLFNRGRSPGAVPAGIEHLRGDRDGDLAALAGRRWDSCIDCSGTTPRQLLASTALLQAAVGHYVFVSAVMAYAPPWQLPVAEDHGRLPPAPDTLDELAGTGYGRAKVRCEDIVAERFPGPRHTLLRPQTVVGPGDPSGRYAFWLQRAQRPGPTLAPGDGSDGLQLIDVHDLARFAVRVVERQLHGAYNLAGPRLDWAGFVALLGLQQPVWVPAPALQHLSFNDLPLYRGPGHAFAALMQISSAKAQAAGLVLSTPAQTLARICA